MKLVLLLLVASTLQVVSAATVRFSKSFPGSSPAYVSIWTDRNGRGEFNDSPAGDMPLPFQLEPAETEAIFSLAAKLDNFTRPLESRLKVAFTGDKVFRYEDGAARNEVKFNFTQDSDALLLLDWFERLSETAMHVLNLEHAIRFDRLGLDKALLQLQVSADRNRLAGATMLLPILDRLAKNKAAFNRVQDRAVALAASIRAAETKTGP